MYTDNEKTIYAVLSRKFEHGRQANALGHLATGIHALLPDINELALDDYRDAQGIRVALISRFPFVVLSSKNGNQLKTARTELLRLGIPHNAFVAQMVASSAEAQLAATREASELEYVALLAFGRREALDPIFRKFSVYSGQTVEAAPPGQVQFVGPV